MATSSSFPLLLPLPPTPRSHRGSSSSSGHLLCVAGNYSVGEEAARKEEEQQLLPVQNNFLLRRDEEKRTKMVRVKEKESDGSELKPLYDDGFGTKSLVDYYAAAREVLVDSDGGPPRWFCPAECGAPVGGSPVLLFLPDIDGTGMGLILHHQSLGNREPNPKEKAAEADPKRKRPTASDRKAREAGRALQQGITIREPEAPSQVRRCGTKQVASKAYYVSPSTNQVSPARCTAADGLQCQKIGKKSHHVPGRKLRRRCYPDAEHRIRLSISRRRTTH